MSEKISREQAAEAWEFLRHHHAASLACLGSYAGGYLKECDGERWATSVLALYAAQSLAAPESEDVRVPESVATFARANLREYEALRCPERMPMSESIASVLRWVVEQSLGGRHEQG